MGILDLLIDRKPAKTKRAKNNAPLALNDVNALASDLQNAEQLSAHLGINQEAPKLQTNIFENPIKNSFLPPSKVSTSGGAAMSTLESMIKKVQRKQTIKEKILDFIGTN